MATTAWQLPVRAPSEGLAPYSMDVMLGTTSYTFSWAYNAYMDRWWCNITQGNTLVAASVIAVGGIDLFAKWRAGGLVPKGVLYLRALDGGSAAEGTAADFGGRVALIYQE